MAAPRLSKVKSIVAQVRSPAFLIAFIIGAGLGITADRFDIWPLKAAWQDHRRAGTSSGVEVYFTPPSGVIERKIVSLISGARKTLLVQAYSFTSLPIAKAVISAKANGAKVAVIADRSNLTSRAAVLSLLRARGIPVYIDTVKGIAHNKVVVIDGHTVITGSFNFSKAAETRNAENIVVIRDQAVADAYIRNIRFRLGQARKSSAAPALGHSSRNTRKSAVKAVGKNG